MLVFTSRPVTGQDSLMQLVFNTGPGGYSPALGTIGVLIRDPSPRVTCYQWPTLGRNGSSTGSVSYTYGKEVSTQPYFDISVSSDLGCAFTSAPVRLKACK